MNIETVLPLLGFCFTLTIKPRPNNPMVTASGANFGCRATVPHILGISVGFSAMLLLVGLGLGEVFDRHPLVHQTVRLAGTGYLLYLAWRIARFTPADEGESPAEGNPPKQRPLFSGSTRRRG